MIIKFPIKYPKNTGDLDALIVGEMPTNKFEILVKEADHSLAEEILLNNAKENLGQIDPGYFLFEFSNEELMDVLFKADEWSELDVALAEKILNDRKYKIDFALIEAEREQRIEEQKKPEDKQDGWILLGYVMAFIGGFFGFLIGYSLWVSKKKLPNGTKVPAYNEGIRRHGRNIFYIGLTMFVILSTYKAIVWLENN